MALALYRKYRPRTFGEVIGQEHVTEPLMQALRTGRLNHAYLFSGPRGCGKTSSARILARSLNCEKGPTPEPCGVCDSCVALAPDGAGSIDVIEIDAASHGGVDDARELREKAFFAPVSSRFKVYVIDEAHMVSSAGFNALLKLVEEPPEYVKFVFATTEPEKVLGTIKSRTHHYPFRLIPPGTLRPYLEELAGREGVSIEAPVFPLVVRAGGGSARDSLSVLDQLIAGAGPGGVTYARAVALLGVTDAALLDEMCDALAASDGSAAYGAIGRVMEAGHDPRRFASDLLERLRDLIVLQQVRDAAAKGLLDYPADQLDRMSAQASRLGLATLTRCAGIVHDGLTEMRGTTAPRLLLEILIARMLLPGADESTGALLQRMERLERRLGAAGELPPAGIAPSGGQGSPAVEVQQDMRRGEPASEATPASPVEGPHRSTAHASPRSAPSQAQPQAQAQRAEETPEPQPAQPQYQAQPQAPAGPQHYPQAPAAPQHQPQASAGPQHQAQVPAASQHQPSHQSTPQYQPQAQPARASEAAAAAPAQPASPPESAGGLDAAAVRRVWDQVLVAVRSKSVREWAVAREATVRDVQGTTLFLLFQHQVHANMLSSSPKTLTDAVAALIGGRWDIRCEIAGQTPTPAQSQAPAQPQSRPAGQADPGHQAPAPSPAYQETPGHQGQPGAPVRQQNQQNQQQAQSVAHQPPAPRPPAGAPTGDDGWPTAAVPGGGHATTTAPAPAGPSAAMQAAKQAAAQAARQGGGQAASQTAQSAQTGQSAHGAQASRAAHAGQSAHGAQASHAAHAGQATALQSPGQPASRGGQAAAHAAAAGVQARAVGSEGQRPQQRSQPQAAAWNEEPPPMYEPDYGFDPGDEPIDEDEPVIRETSEEQALRLLREHLGAERID